MPAKSAVSAPMRAAALGVELACDDAIGLPSLDGGGEAPNVGRSMSNCVEGVSAADGRASSLANRSPNEDGHLHLGQDDQGPPNALALPEAKVELRRLRGGNGPGTQLRGARRRRAPREDKIWIVGSDSFPTGTIQ